jgi:hypothetical protein
LRVTAEEEIDGLDIGEHGMCAYPDFEMVETGSGAGSSAGSRKKTGSAEHVGQLVEDKC